jgi:hypothetical protein
MADDMDVNVAANMDIDVSAAIDGDVVTDMDDDSSCIYESISKVAQIV